MNIIVSNLEKNMKNTLFLETETGQMTIADVFTTNQQLFLVIFLKLIYVIKYSSVTLLSLTKKIKIYLLIFNKVFFFFVEVSSNH